MTDQHEPDRTSEAATARGMPAAADGPPSGGGPPSVAADGPTVPLRRPARPPDTAAANGGGAGGELTPPLLAGEVTRPPAEPAAGELARRGTATGAESAGDDGPTAESGSRPAAVKPSEAFQNDAAAGAPPDEGAEAAAAGPPDGAGTSPDPVTSAGPDPGDP